MEIELAWIHNQNPFNRASYGSELNKHISELLRESVSLLEKLQANVVPILHPDHQKAFPPTIYSLLVETFVRMRNKDWAKSENATFDQQRRLDPTRANVPLRTAVSMRSASAVTKHS